MGSSCRKGQQEDSVSMNVRNEKNTSSMDNIRQFYEIRQTLGHGAFGVVRVGYLKNTKKKYAIKSIVKSRLDRKTLQSELTILKKLNHPNIVRFYEVYQDSKYVHFVQEFCEGGELLDRLKQQKSISERQCQVYMLQVFQAINYLHTMKIVHRDLKLENLMLSDSKDTARIKVIDFGLSKFYGEDQNSNHKKRSIVRMNSMVGTPAYLAPEVIKGQYDQRCDYWSIGVIMFFLLFGQPPFIGSNIDSTFAKILNSKVNYEGRQISDDAKNMISRLICHNPSKRLTYKQAINHPWLKNVSLKKQQNYETKVGELDQHIIDNLIHYQNSLQLSKEIYKVAMFNFINQKQLQELEKAFRILDVENEGYIDRGDLQKILKQKGIEGIDEQIEVVFNNLGVNQNQQKIDYQVFLQAAIQKDFFKNDDNLNRIFDYFDTDNTGFITKSNLEEVFARGGRKLEQEDIKLLLDEFDLYQNDKISYEEFSKVMKYEQEMNPQKKQIIFEEIEEIKENYRKSVPNCDE